MSNYLNLKNIHYSQRYCNTRFHDGTSVQDTADDLANGYTRHTDIPRMRVTENPHTGQVVSLDNRRLRAFEEAASQRGGMNRVPVEYVDWDDCREERQRKRESGSQPHNQRHHYRNY